MSRDTVTTIIVLLLFSASFLSPVQAFDDETPNTPWPTNEWATSTPEEQGMNSTQLQKMLDHYRENEIDVDSVLIIRNGYLVFEEYLSNYGPDDLHHIFSCTKSITSTLIGIAIQNRYLNSLESHVLDVFQDYQFKNPSPEKDSLSIRHLLTMTAGLEWNEEHYGERINDYNRMIRSDDWIQYVLDKQIISEPGETFVYNSGLSHLLSVIIQRAAYNDTLSFAKQNLFDPLGIDTYEWDTDPQGAYRGASRMKLIPRDMAKIGYLYLREGTWENQQILSSDWVNFTSQSLTTLDDNNGYSFQWWTMPDLGVYYALGWGYQSIVVVPESGLVVVVTARTLDSSVQVRSILSHWILPSLGINPQISTTLFFSPLFILVAGSPFYVVALALFMDKRGLWEETD